MLRSKVSPVTAFRYSIPVVAAALLPGTVIGLPVCCTVLLPGDLLGALRRLRTIGCTVCTLLPDLLILRLSRLLLLLPDRRLRPARLLRLPVWLRLRLTSLRLGPGLRRRLTIPRLLRRLLPLSIGRRLLLMILLPRLVLLVGVLPGMILLVSRPVLPGQSRSNDSEKQRENGCADNPR